MLVIDTTLYPLRVSDIQKTVKDTAVISLEIPSDWAEKFAYLSGQYLTLEVNVQNQTLRRAYSICSSPHLDKVLQIGVKQVEKGLVSTYLTQSLKVGDTLQVLVPQGNFVIEPKIETKKDYFLIAGGSGITPLFSILKTIIEAEPKSCVYLYYANKNEDSILFKSELEQLERKYKDQLIVRHILSQPKTEKKGGILGLFAKTVTQWQGDKGRIDAEKLTRFYNEFRHPDNRQAEFYACAAQGLMDTVKNTLAKIGIPPEQVHQEFFSSTAPAQTPNSANSGGNLRVTLNKKTFNIAVQPKETILQALMREKLNPPYSCASGVCSTCMAKVVSGEVSMDRCLALDESEVRSGLILTCTAVLKTDTVEINFDV